MKENCQAPTSSRERCKAWHMSISRMGELGRESRRAPRGRSAMAIADKLLKQKQHGDGHRAVAATPSPVSGGPPSAERRR